MTTFQQMFEKLAAEYSVTEAEEITYIPTYYCAVCREHQVEADGDLCPLCIKERQQGFRVRSLPGRCANGAERGHGTRFHALRFGEFKAVCGAQPGRRSAGFWSTWGHGEQPTCPRCLKKLGS